MLRYNGKSHVLNTQAAKFRHELYAENDSDDDEWTFAGVINHSLAMQPAESADVDFALEALKTRMAADRVEREANRCVLWW